MSVVARFFLHEIVIHFIQPFQFRITEECRNWPLSTFYDKFYRSLVVTRKPRSDVACFFPDPMPLRLLSASGFDWIGPILPRFWDIRADVRGKPVGHFNFCLSLSIR